MRAEIVRSREERRDDSEPNHTTVRLRSNALSSTRLRNRGAPCNNTILPHENVDRAYQVQLRRRGGQDNRLLERINVLLQREQRGY